MELAASTSMCNSLSLHRGERSSSSEPDNDGLNSNSRASKLTVELAEGASSSSVNFLAEKSIRLSSSKSNAPGKV
ncbi:hypothetical protein GOP47_0007728 [Adiantum capillus-veneris]|uniref:Uncharacterized protein n=1 Tax=Adiantum capillus-veneris TaxID=13818 RepID=A0A9D4ZJK6_ADICA|nr:hypothetical protein GOP47_0007728 [Adiantum capillus-veneris]